MVINANEGLTNSNVREFNKRSMLRLFREKRNLTKRDIAITLDLSVPTVSQIMDDLILDGFVTEIGSFSSTGGRKPKCYSFVISSRLSVGLEITQNWVRIVLIDLCANRLGRKFYDISFTDSSDYWEDLSLLVNEFIDSFHPKYASVLGIGISFPDDIPLNQEHLDPTRANCVSEPYLNYLSDLFKHSVKTVNSRNAAGFAELWHSDHFSHMYYLSISKKIHGSIMFNNELYYGFNNRAGTVAHNTIVADNGRPCSCGLTGCFEAYCSTANLTEPFQCTLEEFFLQLHKNSAEHTAVWNEYIRYLAIEIRNIRYMLDMAIVIGGELSDYLDEYMAQLHSELARIGVHSEIFTSFLTLGHHHSDAAVMGAALCHIDQFLNG